LPDLVILGIFLLLGWAAHGLGKLLRLPRVTLLLIVGLVAGPSFLDVIPHELANWFPIVAHMALAMIGFLLGESFIGREIKERGRTVLYVSIGKTIGAGILVFIVVLLMQHDLSLALLLAGIAPASAPAATVDVIREGHAKGPLTKTVLGIVAIDDAWVIILYSLLLVVAEALCGKGQLLEKLLWGFWDVGGAFLLGVVVGIPMAWLTGRIKEGEPTLLEASGFVFLCGGLAFMLHVSYLLACMVLGATIANRAKHYTRPFRDIEGASEPFLVIFFLLAGYKFELAVLQTLGIVGLLYIVARSLGFVIGCRLSARLINAQRIVQEHVGWCLLPQAGVALGLALYTTERLPELGTFVLPLIVGTTIIFELIGPLITRYHLHKAGEL
jgi:Kef-type K+ transport system membrane component KefB